MKPARASRQRLATLVAAAGASALLLSCAATAPGARSAARSAARAAQVTRAPESDSITTGLWHFDEIGGTRATDAGPFHLDGVAGLDTRTDFGRIRNARLFTPSVESFVLVPYNPMLERGSGLSIEAWIYLNDYGAYEDTPIALRWTPRLSEQSWVFSVIGKHTPLLPGQSPGDFLDLSAQSSVGHLAFAFQTDQAGSVQAYASNLQLDTGRWTHVGVTCDGTVVRFWIDGLPDAQYACRGTIRHGTAPLLVGNALDPHLLSDFGGDLRADAIIDRTPYYAFNGYIDELRISSAARALVTAGH